ncbi:hypothetical protein BDAP_002094 [Binucleata daphniae]
MKDDLTLVSGTIVMITTMMGFGVVMMPRAIDSTGYITGPIILAIVALFCFLTLYGISYAAYVFRKMHAQREEVSKSEELAKESSNIDINNRENDFIQHFSNNITKQNDAAIKNEEILKTTSQFFDENGNIKNEYKFTCIDKNDEKKESKAKKQENEKLSDSEREIKKHKKQTEETKTHRKINDNTKQEVLVTYYNVTHSYFPLFATLVDLCMVVQGVGSCLTYVVALSKWIPLILDKEINPIFIIIGVVFPLYFLSLRKNLSALKYASYLSVASVFYLLILCVYYCFTLFTVSDNTLERKPLQKYNNNYYQAIGTIIFAMGCHQNIVQVFSELQNKSVGQITLVSLFCIIAGTFIYLTIGLCGYFAVGSGIERSILEVLSENKDINSYMSQNTFDKGGYLIKIGLVAFVCVMLCAFPMQMHPARDAATNMLCKINAIKKKLGSGAKVDKLKMIITTVFTLFVAIIAMIPNLNYSSVMGVIGATATNAITYIFPSIVFCCCIGKVNTKSVISGFIGISGIALMIYLLYKQFTIK